MNKGPLSGIRVVEMSTFVAAPVTARLLADLGADVIKIEAPTGDGWRDSGIGMGPNRFNHDENPVFDIYNTGKKLISLNMKTPKGKEAFLSFLKAPTFSLQIFVCPHLSVSGSHMKISKNAIRALSTR